ncbi:MAG: class II fructose-bisphosphate aldolase [Candidatus Caldatribacteriaceae bacterium]
MPLVSTKKLVHHAWENKYAVGYFESWNLESTLAVVDAAEEMRAPVIVGFNGGFLAHEGRRVKENVVHYAAMALAIAAGARVPVGLLLNECRDVVTAIQGLLAGFNGVMYVNEEASLEEEISTVRFITQIAHCCDIYVEGEMGRLPAVDVRRGTVGEGELTNPETAAFFVRETGVDALSVSVGNVHTLVKGKAWLQHDLIQAIGERVNVPLVLHGGTGIVEEDIQEAIRLGISKVNVGTILKKIFVDSLKDSLDNLDAGSVDFHALVGGGGEDDLLSRARMDVAREVKRLIKVFGSDGKADMW